jgi:hypothetical protein
VDSYYAGAYWGPRQESDVECAERLSACLARLAGVSSSFSPWFKKGASRAAASKDQVDTSSPEVLRALLASGQNRRDIGRDVISELGFRAALWNRADNSAAFSVTCGLYIENPALKNSFVLQLPELTEDTASLFAKSSAIDVIKVLVESWEPDWATWSSRGWRSSQTVDAVKPVFGWVTYIADRSAEGLSLPSSVVVEPLNNGILVSIDSELDSVSGEQMAALQASA